MNPRRLATEHSLQSCHARGIHESGKVDISEHEYERDSPSPSSFGDTSGWSAPNINDDDTLFDTVVNDKELVDSLLRIFKPEKTERINANSISCPICSGVADMKCWASADGKFGGFKCRDCHITFKQKRKHHQLAEDDQDVDLSWEMTPVHGSTNRVQGGYKCRKCKKIKKKERAQFGQPVCDCKTRLLAWNVVAAAHSHHMSHTPTKTIATEETMSVKTLTNTAPNPTVNLKISKSKDVCGVTTRRSETRKANVQDMCTRCKRGSDAVGLCCMCKKLYCWHCARYDDPSPSTISKLSKASWSCWLCPK